MGPGSVVLTCRGGDDLGQPKSQRTVPHGTLSGYTYHGCRCALCRAKKSETARAYHAANPGRGRARAKAWRTENPDRYREQMREWARAHPDYVAARGASWRARNRDAARENSRRRRVRRYSGDVRLVTTSDWHRLLRRHDHRCAYCGERRPLTQDHIIPIARGGRHAIGNLLPACMPCNSSKGSKLLIEWRRMKANTPQAAR